MHTTPQMCASIYIYINTYIYIYIDCESFPKIEGFTPKLPYSNQVKKPCFSAVQCLMSFRPPSLKMPAEGTAHDPMHMVAMVGTCHDSPVKMATTGWNINTHQTSKQQNKTKQKKEKQHKPTTPKPTQQSASLCPT